MKTLYLLGGTMGVGKTTTAQYLKKELPNAVFLDGDWCWDASPFQVTPETKTMVLDNICHLLNNFVHCSAYDNILFCWVLQEQSTIDAILAGVDTAHCAVKVISLLASPETLTERILRGVAGGTRTADVLQRSLERLPLYAEIRSTKIVTDGKTVGEVAQEILRAAALPG